MNLITIGTNSGKMNYQFIPIDYSYEKLIPELLLKDELQLTPVRINGLSSPNFDSPPVIIKYSSMGREQSISIKTELPETLYKRCLEGKTSTGYAVRDKSALLGLLINLQSK
jgi:hypothetical protein